MFGGSARLGTNLPAGIFAESQRDFQIEYFGGQVP
jgi:hypothetical protein